jgi:predicted RNase H-like nuclease (RuvC/YqgF family)
MSTSTNIDGQKIVSISEVIRVYGDINKNSDYETALEHGKSGNLEVLELKHKLDLLSQENEQLKQRLDDKEKNLEDLRQATKLLTNQGKKPSWLARILGS